MTVNRLSAAVFLGTLIAAIEERTGIPCYDCPDNEASPLYSVELLQTEPDNTKTAYIDRFDIRVHCIAAPTAKYSSAPVLRLVQTLEEAMAFDIELDEPFSMFRQECGGIRALMRDESDEGHAVVDFSFFVCYGFRCK